MEAFAAFTSGLAFALQPENLFYVFVGVLIGNFVGVLPGLGPITGIALLIPFTFGMDPTTALILLAGVYYGSMYGGAITAVLLNIPGEPSAVMTALEGHQLARKGRAGAALTMAALSSFVAGTIGAIALLILTPFLARMALSFGPPEEFGLFLLAFTLVSALSGSLVKGMAMTAVGIVLATIGPEPVVAATRLTFGTEILRPGIDFVAAAIGLFAIPSVLEGVERPAKSMFVKTSLRLRALLPNRQEFKESASAFPVGTAVGFFGSVLPGIGMTEASLLSYGIQKRISRHPEKFGKGSMEGLVSVEAANNSSAVGGLVPMFSFGIPSSATTAVLMGAMLIHGLSPGPMLMTTNSDVVYGLIGSMYVGNLVLLILNIPLISLWVFCLRLPNTIVITSIMVLSVIGVYAVDNSVNSVIVMFAFGLLGYILNKIAFPAAPIILALILTAPLEAAFAKSLSLSGGDWTIFFQRPIAVALICAAVLLVALQLPLVRWFRAAASRAQGA